MQFTRQRVRPAMDMHVEEVCPTCFGKGVVKPSLLFTDTLEHKIDYLVNNLGQKRFKLYVNPYVEAYITKGLISLYLKWQLTYGFGVKIYPSQDLGFLQYKFIDPKGEEIDMTEEMETR
jgi:ribonuclease G